MLNKLHRDQEAPHAKCVALLVESIEAVRAQKQCLMCGAKLARRGFAAHRLAVRLGVLTFLLGISNKNPANAQRRMTAPPCN